MDLSLAGLKMPRFEGRSISSAVDIGRVPASAQDFELLEPADGRHYVLAIGARVTQHRGLTTWELDDHAVRFNRWLKPDLALGLRSEARLDVDDVVLDKQLTALEDVVTRIAQDYSELEHWRSRDEFPAGWSHQIWGTVTVKHVSASGERAHDEWDDRFMHVDFVEPEVPAVGYFFSNNNATTFYNGTFRYCGTMVSDYEDRLSRMEDDRPGLQLLDVDLMQSRPNRIIRSNDVRSLLHRSNILMDSTRVFGRVFVGPVPFP